MLGGLGGGGDDEGDPYNFDMGGGPADPIRAAPRRQPTMDKNEVVEEKIRTFVRQRPAKKAPPKRPSSKAGRSLGPKPISSDVGTKTFKKASASDVLAKAQAMLSKAPTGSGQKKKESRRSRSPSMDADAAVGRFVEAVGVQRRA